MNMKRKNLKTILIITFTLILLPCLWPNQAGEKKEEAKNPPPTERFGILGNGLSVFVKQRDNLPLANIVFAVNVGSKNETSDTSGLVHLLEHMLLLGETESYTTADLNREMRKHGAHFNAHTSHDVMTFEISLPAQYWEFGLKVLKEKLFHLKLSQEHLDKEKPIIYKELDQHQDNPITMGTYLALSTLFKGHPYERPITGDRKVIENATLDQLRTFYRQYFIPSNSSLAVVGDLDPVPAANKIKEMFGSLAKPGKTPPIPSFPKKLKLKKTVKIKKKLDIRQCHLILAFLAPPSNHDDQLAMDFLNQIFGKGLSPLLPRMLIKRGKRLTTSVSTRYFPFKHGGAFLVYMTLDKKHLNSARLALMKFLNKSSWRFNYSKEDYPLGQRMHITDFIETAQNNIKFSHQQFQELGLNAAVTYARYLLFTKGKKSKKAPYMERVSKMTSRKVRDAASDYFSGKKYVLITLLPEKKKK